MSICYGTRLIMLTKEEKVSAYENRIITQVKGDYNIEQTAHLSGMRGLCYNGENRRYESKGK